MFLQILSQRKKQQKCVLAKSQSVKLMHSLTFIFLYKATNYCHICRLSIYTYSRPEEDFWTVTKTSFLFIIINCDVEKQNTTKKKPQIEKERLLLLWW